MTENLTVTDLIRLLSDTERDLRLAAIYELGRRNSLRAVKPLLQAHLRRDPYEQSSILATLRNMGDLALPPLNSIFLKDVNHALRAQAAYVLGELGHTASIRVLAKGVYMPHEMIRSMAVAALGKYRHPDVLPPLLHALDDDSEMVRIEAALGLGRQGDVRAVELLTHVLVHERVLPANRALVLDALAATGDPRVVETIYDAFCEGDANLRLAAVRAIGRFAGADPRVATFLRQACADQSPFIANTAADHLRRRMDQGAG